MFDCQIVRFKALGTSFNQYIYCTRSNAGLGLRAAATVDWGALAESYWWQRCLLCHPLRVESVAWVSERKDVLSGFFGLARPDCLRRLRT